MIIEKIIKEGVVVEKTKIRMKGNVKAAIIELNDTYFDIRREIKKTPKVISVANG